ncbi:MAG TPA: glycosyltransferase family 87 protein, partial [Anaerolineales bacterium]|nr:glycosyltransferase family 87 protein [Anaerolineales bacterium]
KAILFAVINITMLLFMTYGIIRYAKLKQADAWFLYPLALGFAPFLELLHVGQVNQFIEFCIFLMFIFAMQAPWLAGFGLGWAAMLKATPAVFLAYLFIARKWKALATTAATILFFTFLTWIRYGSVIFVNYVDAFRLLLGQFPDGLESHSLFAVINRLIDIHEQAPLLQAGLNFYLILILASGVISHYIGRTDLFFVTLGMGIALTPNLLWYHHYVFLLLPLFVLMCWSGLHPRVVAWCLLGFIIIQLDRFHLTGGLLIHFFGHITILGLIGYQASLAQNLYKNKTQKIS